MYIYNLILNLYIYTKPWPRIDGLCRKKRTKVTSREPGCSSAVQGLPLLNECSEPKKTVHGLPVQSRVAAAIRQSLHLAR